MKATFITIYKKIAIAANAINNISSLCLALVVAYFSYKHSLEPTIKNILLALSAYTASGSIVNIIADGQKEMKQ